jgi:glycosyltransferase involved in cell wall biosynthesis
MGHDFSPLVSIITPTFNHEAYIGPCIESVLRQTYAHWEQIIIDDGSTDGTAKVIERYKDPRIRYFYQENQGALALARTYNRALHLAKGELIAILEGDDFWPQDKLATLVPGFLDADVVLAYGEVSDVNAQGSEQRRVSRSTRRWRLLPRSVLFNDPVGSATRYMLLSEGRALVGPSTVIVRRRVLDEIGGFQCVQGLPHTDYPTFMELSLRGKFFYVRATMGYRRWHLTSVSMSYLKRISEYVCTFSLSFLERHCDKIALTPSQRQEMEQGWQKSRCMREFSQGRFLLARKQWREARSRFRVALKSKDLSVCLAGVIGYFFSWFHLDIELLMRLAGRVDLRERVAQRATNI